MIYLLAILLGLALAVILIAPGWLLGLSLGALYDRFCKRKE
jgi:hypothetical protein